MIFRLKAILDTAFSYKESLKRQNLKQESVDKLREKLKNSKIMPQASTDKQVSGTFL